MTEVTATPRNLRFPQGIAEPFPIASLLTPRQGPQGKPPFPALCWLCNAISGITLWWGQQMFSASLPLLREQQIPCCPHHKAQFFTLTLPALEKLP